MSTTMVVTMASPPPTTTLTTSVPTSTSCCPSCGDSLPSIEETQQELSQAQARIVELESQLRHLNEKASTAASRLSSYEDELTKLRAQDGPPPPPPPKNDPIVPKPLQHHHHQRSSPDRLAPHPMRSNTSPNLRPTDRPPVLHRINSVPAVLPPETTTEDLLQALNREQGLRKEAEGRLTATSKEIEELSVSLFEQANEMVADERRARAKLEERVGELEKRDMEKRRRLEKLETALTRIERVRTLLAE